MVLAAAADPYKVGSIETSGGLNDKTVRELLEKARHGLDVTVCCQCSQQSYGTADRYISAVLSCQVCRQVQPIMHKRQYQVRMLRMLPCNLSVQSCGVEASCHWLA
jgi:hypothetical protein